MKLALGKRLRLIRGSKSQQEFAAALEMHRNTAARYERGEREPDIDYLVRVSNTFKVNAAWLLTGEGPMSKDEDSASINLILLGKILSIIDCKLGRESASMPSEIKAMILGVSYMYLSDESNPNIKDADTIRNVVNTVLENNIFFEEIAFAKDGPLRSKKLISTVLQMKKEGKYHGPL